VIVIFAFFVIFFWLAFEQAGGTMTIFARDYTARGLSSSSAVTTFRIGSLLLTFIPMILLTWVLIQLGVKIIKKYPLTILFTAFSFLIIWGIIIWINFNNFNNETLEVPASWFGILNSFFIISLAPLFSWMWLKLDGKTYNPSGPIKFALGLFFLGLGFVALVFGALPIAKGAQTASVSMIWLFLAYFFHTIGELFLSPVGLSYVNKLSPVRLMALMFGVWYIANFIANFTGGIIGSYIDRISEVSSLSGFFSIFVISSAVAGLALVLLNKPLKRMMHGVE
jgi:POT family proton-dependent oligopeptide transporter